MRRKETCGLSLLIRFNRLFPRGTVQRGGKLTFKFRLLSAEFRQPVPKVSRMAAAKSP
jgi:hypothetical protein